MLRSLLSVNGDLLDVSDGKGIYAVASHFRWLLMYSKRCCEAFLHTNSALIQRENPMECHFIDIRSVITPMQCNLINRFWVISDSQLHSVHY